jgi:branched-chain amino acid transport system permease protein
VDCVPAQTPPTTGRIGGGFPLIVLLVALLALVPGAASLFDDPFLIRLFTRIVIFAMAAAALNFMLGFGGFASLLHGAFMGIGGYVVGILAYHDVNEPLQLGLLTVAGTSDLAISLPLGALAAAILAAVTGPFCLRASGIYFIMITLAFNQMIFYFLVALQTYGGEDGLQILGRLSFLGIPVTGGASYYYVSLAALALALLAFEKIVASRFGTVLRAISQNERRVVTLGIPTLPYKLAAFVLSGCVTGVAGALLAASQNFVSPADLSWIRSADLIIMAVLGGTTLVWGAVLGSAGFFVAQLLLSSWSAHWQLPFGLLVILTGAVLKQGLGDLLILPLSRIRTRHAV